MLVDCDLLYFTGISLAMTPLEYRENLVTLLKEFRSSGGRVGFDPNYRPVLWRDDSEAREWIDLA